MIRQNKLAYNVAVMGFLIAVGVGPASSQEETENKNVVAFEIQSILSNKCFDCHGVDRQTNGLRLDDRPRALAGGNSGKAAIVPGDAIASAMIYRITLPDDHKSAMPPEGRERLTAEEVLKIAHWIYSGANWPAYADDQELAGTTSPPKPTDDGSGDSLVQGPVDFNRDIQPVLAQKCTPCHDAKEATAGLTFDTAAGVQAVQAKEGIIVAGDPDASELFYRISVPSDDDDIMPPAATKNPLTAKQIELIRQWIAQGAGLGEVLPVAQAADAEPEEQIEPASDEAIVALQETGAVVVPLAQGTNRLQVNFSPVADQIGDEHLSLLAPLSEQLTWLNLSRSSITDDGLEQLASLGRLKKLHLDNTSISGVALAHIKSLGKLEYLNLYSTGVDDDGLSQLNDMKHLKRIYLWQTSVTEEGIGRLREALPELAISFGWNYELKQKLMAILKEPIDKSLQLSQAITQEALIQLLVRDDLEAVEALEKVINQKRLHLEQKAKALEDPYTLLVSLFDKGRCCATAHEAGKRCEHPCCVEARGQNKVCLKCNPGAADKQKDQ